MKTLLPAKITRTVSMNVLKAKKNSPHIFFGAGVIGTIVSMGLTVRATLKLEDWVDETQEIVKKFKDAEAREDHEKEFEYWKLCGIQLMKLARLYGPALGVQALSIAALTGAHVQQTRRNAALTATIATVAKAYDEYRARMAEELGEERELAIYREHDPLELRTKENPEPHVVNTSKFSPYARIFDETNSNYHKNVELNRNFLHLCQNRANHMLHMHGHVFLNDVYDMLGFERTREGMVIGWILGGEGDDFIDFGLFDGEISARFINGLERSVILDFNVDGVLHDYI